MRYFLLNSNASHPLKCTSVGPAIGCCQSVGIRILRVALNHTPFKGGEETMIKVREQRVVEISATTFLFVCLCMLEALLLQSNHTRIYILWDSFHLIGAPQNYGFTASEMTCGPFYHIFNRNGRIPYFGKICCRDEQFCRNGIALLFEQTHALIRPFGIVEQAVFAEPYMNRFVQEREEASVCCVCCVYKDERRMGINQGKRTEFVHIEWTMCICSDLSPRKDEKSMLYECVA